MIKYLHHRPYGSSYLVVIHSWKIVVDQRHENHLKSTSRWHSHGYCAANHFTSSKAQNRAGTLRAPANEVAHRLILFWIGVDIALYPEHLLVGRLIGQTGLLLGHLQFIRCYHP